MPDDATPQPHVPAETKGRQKTIAVVAQEWHLRMLVRAAVENKRTRIVEASTLQELRAVAQGERLDLVILDGDLAPGHTAAAQSKRDSAFQDTPLLLLTDRDLLETPLPDGALQPNRTLHKHFSPFELLNIVYALIGY